jgi:hypothetical protein
VRSRPQFEHLILQITDACPLECAYCCVESGPWRKETMELEDGLRYLTEAKALNPDFFLSFTGGEPFVRFPLMRDIVRAAHEMGVWHTTITSAVWCKSKAFALERLGELQSYGLRTLSVSYDSYHSPWVSRTEIENCVEAGAELGLNVLVAGSVTRGSKGARDLLGDWPDQFPNVRVSDGWVQPTGRARQIPADELLTEDFGSANLGCPVAADILIRADGVAYPCCSTGGDYDYLQLGNAREMSIAELRGRAESSVWFQAITQDGFAALERIVRRYHPDVEFPRRHLGVCHLCSLVFGGGELGAKVRDAIGRYESERSERALESLALLVSSA